MLTDEFKRRNPEDKLVLKSDFEDKVALLKFHPGLNPELIRWYVEKGYKGLVLEGTGLGHVSKYCFEAIKNATESNALVTMTSQCIWGRVNMNVYDTGRDLLALGVLPLEDMLSETALVKLMWVLGQTKDTEEARKLMITDIAGELSTRTPPQNTSDE
jgi:glutamyl-tRNA(Gln) amidotransferase subunit D